VTPSNLFAIPLNVFASHQVIFECVCLFPAFFFAQLINTADKKHQVVRLLRWQLLRLELQLGPQTKKTRVRFSHLPPLPYLSSCEFYLALQPPSRSGRERRPSDRVLAQSKTLYYINLSNIDQTCLSVREEDEVAARKEEQARRRTARERTKAQQIQDATGNIPDEVDDEREERYAGTV